MNLAVGVWLIICGFILGMQTPSSLTVAGVVAFIFGFWGAAGVNSWQGSINGIIGIWLFLSGIEFALAVQWNFFISGIFIIVLALWDIAGHEAPAGR